MYTVTGEPETVTDFRNTIVTGQPEMVTDFRTLSPANRTAGFKLELNVTQRPRRNIVREGVVGV